MDSFKKKTAYETSSDRRAINLFRHDAEAALSHQQAVSAEADAGVQDEWQASPNRKKSKMVYEIAVAQPERFLELVSYLPHAIQDIFYQYYLLGRTQTQIGELLSMSQTAVWQALELGIDAVAAIILFGGPPPAPRIFSNCNDPTRMKAHIAYNNMLNFQTKPESRQELIVDAPTTLGEFILRTDDPDINDQFAPCTPDGPARRK